MQSFDELRDIIAATLKIPIGSINEDSADGDIAAWDSLGHVNIMMALEQAFDIDLEVEEFAELTSIPAILARLNKEN